VNVELFSPTSLFANERVFQQNKSALLTKVLSKSNVCTGRILLKNSDFLDDGRALIKSTFTIALY